MHRCGEDATEEPLPGRITTTVRVGDTVRRSTGPWTPAVHALLDHLERVGFTAAPRARGRDEQGRECLSYLPGDVAGSAPWPGWVWSDVTLRQVGELLREYHAAVASFVPPPDVVWRAGKVAMSEGQIVCHNDLSPLNVVHSGSRVSGFLDWDFASPALPKWDLAHVAWQFVPLHHPKLADNLGYRHGERAQRLRTLCDAYRLHHAERNGFVQLVRDRVCATRDGILAFAKRDSVFARLIEDGHVSDMDETIEFIDSNGGELERLLH